MEWNQINNKEDIKFLMNKFGGFHDSCLKELLLSTESFVDQNFAMAPNPNTNVRVLLQRQNEDASAIELLFEEINKITIVPAPENCDSIILGATILYQDGLYFWANVDDWTPEENSDYVSWISAKSLKWRDVSSWMGEKMRYGVLE
jgi:hypothetical protein